MVDSILVSVDFFLFSKATYNVPLTTFVNGRISESKTSIVIYGISDFANSYANFDLQWSIILDHSLSGKQEISNPLSAINFLISRSTT